MSSEKIKFLILRTIGNFLILTSILGLIATFGPALTNEVMYRLNRFRPTPKILTPVDPNFSIIIPKINANVRIISNVNTSNYNEYIQALSQGVAHAKGTVFPGMKGNIFLFAHSTDNFWNVGRYNAVFYLLKELEKGDEVNLFFGGKRFIYEVYDKKIIEAGEADYLNKKVDEEILTLQTCWPSGTTWRRLLVFGKRINAD